MCLMWFYHMDPRTKGGNKGGCFEGATGGSQSGVEELTVCRFVEVDYSGRGLP